MGCLGGPQLMELGMDALLCGMQHIFSVAARAVRGPQRVVFEAPRHGKPRGIFSALLSGGRMTP